MSGESLGTLDNATTSSVEIAVECGCFRILEIRGDEGAVTWQLNHGNRVRVVTPIHKSVAADKLLFFLTFFYLFVSVC